MNKQRKIKEIRSNFWISEQKITKRVTVKVKSDATLKVAVTHKMTCNKRIRRIGDG